jgi:hypothetical protein
MFIYVYIKMYRREECVISEIENDSSLNLVKIRVLKTDTPYCHVS